MLRLSIFHVLPLLLILLVLAGVDPPAILAQEEAEPALAAAEQPEAAPPPEEEAVEEEGLAAGINTALDEFLGTFTNAIFSVLFFSIVPVEGVDFPLIVAVLILGALLFTFWFKFLNIWGLRHAIEVVRGRYDDPEDEGEVSHFRALTSALSATVGLGNIAGVALAIGLGGPGAVFWMTLAGFFGMASKFTECTLGQMYRRVNADGTISGGPMYYLSQGLAQMGGPWVYLGKVLAVFFCLMVMGAALGGGNMFQSNQAWAALSYTLDLGEGNQLNASIFGIILVIMVAVVVIGGIRRIGAATARIVPLMAAIYILGALVVLTVHVRDIPAAVWTIVVTAFSPQGVAGGFLGVLIMGVRRAAFSSEAGLGSASIAHSAAKTKEPVREGYVALLEPLIDTVIICNITALVIVVTGVYTPEVMETLPGGTFGGVVMTKAAFETVMPWFPWVLTLCIILFAYSTMIAWCYYGERGWIFLLDQLSDGLGLRTILIFRAIFIVFVYIGVVGSLDAVVDFSDAMLLSMAFPNIIGCIILLPVLTRAVKDYRGRLDGGLMQPLHSASLVRQLRGRK